MTACVDNNTKKGGAKKAVSATLAGVLAVGMVPAVALAADEAPEAEEGGVELLVAENAFENATLTSVTDNAGVAVDVEEGEGTAEDPIELAFTGTSHYIKSVSLELADGNETPITVTNGNDYAFTYYKGSVAEGNIVTPNQVQDNGETYILQIECVKEGSLYEGETFDVAFKIVLEESKDDVAIEMITAVEDGAVEATSENITFNNTDYEHIISAQEGSLAVVVNGQPVNPDSMIIYKADNTAAGAQLGNGDIFYAGNYIASVTYKVDGSSKTVAVPFTVNPFNLANATVVSSATSNVDDVNGKNPIEAADYEIAGPNQGVKGFLKVTYSAAKNNGQLQASISKNGGYTFTLSLDESNVTVKGNLTNFRASITGTKDFDISYVANTVEVTYDDEPWKSTFGPYTIGGGEMFSTSDIDFVASDGSDVPAKNRSITVTNAAGEVVTNWATTPGEYTVVAAVNDSTYKYGGSATATFTVQYDQAETDGIYISYKGELVGNDGIEKTYDGTDVIEGISVKVVNGEYTMVEGTDYEIVYTNDITKKEVSEIVDAGTYEMTVKPITFKFDDVSAASIPVKIKAIEPTKLRVANQITINEDKEGSEETGLAYTGAAITPVIEYTTAELDGDNAPEDAEWTVLPADLYTAAYAYTPKDGGATKYVDEVKEIGSYSIEVTLNADVVNYSLAQDSETEVKVIDAKRFIDVPADQWYAPFVDKAAANGYMYGYSDGSIFGPNDAIKRGDAVVVIARMAGIDLWIDENAGSETKFFETPFDDVDGNLYYAQAIAWAANAGIVTGDLGQDTFRPEDSISRQEFATMLVRYAQKAGSDVTVDTAAELAKYTDGASVADWAGDAVAWLSSEGIMTGHAGTTLMDPTSSVTRAQVAKMTTEYQPKAL